VFKSLLANNTEKVELAAPPGNTALQFLDALERNLAVAGAHTADPAIPIRSPDSNNSNERKLASANGNGNRTCIAPYAPMVAEAAMNPRGGCARVLRMPEGGVSD